MIEDLKYEVEEIIENIEKEPLYTSLSDVIHSLKNLIDNIEKEDEYVTDRINNLESELDEYRWKEDE